MTQTSQQGLRQFIEAASTISQSLSSIYSLMIHEMDDESVTIAGNVRDRLRLAKTVAEGAIHVEREFSPRAVASMWQAARDAQTFLAEEWVPGFMPESDHLFNLWEALSVETPPVPVPEQEAVQEPEPVKQILADNEIDF